MQAEGLSGGPSMEPQAALSEQEALIREGLKRFWDEEEREIEAMGLDANEYKNHQLPLARIKKIMKSDEDVRMIASEAPILFAKACEFFILELTHRAWSMSEDIKRKTLQRVDVARAIAKTDTMDFLQDIITVEEGAGPGPSATPTAARGAGPAPGMPPMAAPLQLSPGFMAQGMMHPFGHPGGNPFAAAMAHPGAQAGPGPQGGYGGPDDDGAGME